MVVLSQSSKNSGSNDSKEKDIMSGRSSPSDINSTKGDIQPTPEMLQSLSNENHLALAAESKDRFNVFESSTLLSPDTKVFSGSAPPYAGYGGQTMFLSSPRDPPRESENGCSDLYRSYFNQYISDYDSSKRLAASIFESGTNPDLAKTATATSSSTVIDYPHSLYPKCAFEGYQRDSFEDAGDRPKHGFGVEMRENEYSIGNMDIYRMTQSMVKSESGIWPEYVPPEIVEKNSGMSSSIHDFHPNNRTE